MFNRPFLSSIVPLFQNESKCGIIVMKMSSACSFIFMQITVNFIRIVLHLDSLWNRGTRELGNGLFILTSNYTSEMCFNNLQSVILNSTRCLFHLTYNYTSEMCFNNSVSDLELNEMFNSFWHIIIRLRCVLITQSVIMNSTRCLIHFDT